VDLYHGTIESVLSGGVTVWYGNTTAQDRKAIQRVVRMAEKIIGCALFGLLDYWTIIGLTIPLVFQGVDLQLHLELP